MIQALKDNTNTLSLLLHYKYWAVYDDYVVIPVTRMCVHILDTWDNVRPLGTGVAEGAIDHIFPTFYIQSLHVWEL